MILNLAASRGVHATNVRPMWHICLVRARTQLRVLYCRFRGTCRHAWRHARIGFTRAEGGSGPAGALTGGERWEANCAGSPGRVAADKPPAVCGAARHLHTWDTRRRWRCCSRRIATGMPKEMIIVLCLCEHGEEPPWTGLLGWTRGSAPGAAGGCATAFSAACAGKRFVPGSVISVTWLSTRTSTRATRIPPPSSRAGQRATSRRETTSMSSSTAGFEAAADFQWLHVVSRCDHSNPHSPGPRIMCSSGCRRAEARGPRD